MSSDPSAIEAPLDLNELITFARDYQLTRIIWSLSLALLLYDWLLMIGDEITYIWLRRFKWTNILYCINRYWPMINVLLDNIVFAVQNNSNKAFCKAWLHLVAYGSIPFEISVCAVYILRLWAMYACSATLLAILCTIYVMVLVSESIVISKMTGDVIFGPMVIPGITGCIPTNFKSYTWAFWIPMLVFETILMLLSLYRTAQMVHREYTTPTLIWVLLRDSLVYFGGATVAIAINMAAEKIGGPDLFSTFLPLGFIAFSILTSRLALHIQAAAESQPGTKMTTTTENAPQAAPFESLQFQMSQDMSETDVEQSGVELEDYENE